MQTLNSSTATKFLAMTDGLQKTGDEQRVDCGMQSPIWIKLVGPMNGGRIVSMTRYRILTDRKVDPSINFLVTVDGKVAPLTYRNDYSLVVHAAVEPDGRGGHVVRKKLQARLCALANDWIERIWLDKNSEAND